MLLTGCHYPIYLKLNKMNAVEENLLPILIGYRCPICGNEVSIEDTGYIDETPLCLRCPNGEYTAMEPVYDDSDYSDFAEKNPLK